jgi:hypothetical protein
MVLGYVDKLQNEDMFLGEILIFFFLIKDGRDKSQLDRSLLKSWKMSESWNKFKFCMKRRLDWEDLERDVGIGFTNLELVRVEKPNR